MGSAPARVLIVGAGIAGAACATVLRAAGLDVSVRERASTAGGRMASPTLGGRPVDLGAAYFTVQDDRFAAVVADWERRGLARPWTDTLDVFDSDGRSTASGPQRWAAVGGLSSLVRDLHVDVVRGDELSALPVGYDATVLAMPDPQAARLAGDLVDGVGWVDYDPVITVVAGWPERSWSFDAAFVNDDPFVAMLGDDGARRGDGAPVLVIHSTSDFARAHLDDPHQVVTPSVRRVQQLVGIDAPPLWTHVHRWTFAKPAGTHGAAPFALTAGLLGVCGDSWCPNGVPRVEAAWLSGHRLGTELARRLG